ncbi:hypothetical protein EW146_g8262 [Bondarzewia mesenterica]|uniref:Uncharacterized protein n=1 Tax=Bondarzewia mesenterica TaxID=1095465 RepID=A0A4S4LG30_9AGAM|nr:hypothetical protein EW146_g8262 [Bondarzewia mesenterica]
MRDAYACRQTIVSTFFSKGISSLLCVSGTKHKDICRILLGLVVGLQLPNNLSPCHLIRAIHALLDFTYLAQYPSHSTETLQYMENALHQFYDNKDILVQLGVRDNFKIPKLHSLWHFATSIMLFRTPDNYDTVYTEHLHIDLAKDAYRTMN